VNRLLERDGVLDATARLLEHAREGHAGTLFALAEAGLGKTTVLDAACRQASQHAFSIGLARGDAMEAVLPFGFLAHALAGLGGRGVLDSPGSGPPGADSRAARFYSVQRWLEAAASGPVLLALDDLHWADADSLALLSFLCRRLSSLPVAVIATLRPYPTSARQAAEALSQDGYASIERLGPLSNESAAVLLASQGRPYLDASQVERAIDICAGNPLLLEQVAFAVGRGERLPRPSENELPGLDGRLLLARFAGLPEDGLACARAGGVFGIRFRPDLAVQLADLNPREADQALDALERSGLVRPGRPGWVEFVHPLFRQALYDDLGGSIRARFHARAFALLVERGLEEAAVEHAVMADLAGDPVAIMVLQRVGVAAHAKGALATAISVLQSAADLAGDQASPELLCQLAEAMAAGGRPADAADICERVLRLAGPTAMIRARTLRALARARVYLGDFQAPARLVDECVELSQPSDPEFAVETLFTYARLVQMTDGPVAALAVVDKARAIAKRCAAPYQWTADCAWAVAALDTGDPSGMQASKTAARAFESAAATASEHVLLVGGGALINYATAAKYTDLLAESERYYLLRLRHLKGLASPEEEAVGLMAYVGALQRLLRLGEAVAMNDRCAKLADLVPLIRPHAAVDQANLALLAGRLGESEEAARQADGAVSALRAWQPSLFLAYGRAWRCVAEGRLGDACAVYEQIEATSARVGLREPCQVPWARHAVTAYVGSGRPADAQRVIAWLEDCASTLPCRWPRIAMAHGRALLAEAAGDNDQADELFQQAMAIHEEADLPLEWLQTLLEYGRFLRRSGHLQRSRPVLARAINLAEATGAEWLARQARDELRVAGGRRRRQNTDPRGLTPQEQRVADLAASRSTNTEIARSLFISVSTVETHLAHIFAKLGIGSRRELRAALAEHQRATPTDRYRP
jgi:ATP/maltotriose-dependent transcriptional regulator MalT